MAEQLDVYDANGKLIGVADRDVVHTFGLWHKTVHCWIVLSDGRIVFQRRAQHTTNGGRLYTTASGHISAGETAPEAFSKEIMQEVGIKIAVSDAVRLPFFSPFVFDQIKVDGKVFADRVFPEIYFAKYSDSLESFKFQDGEVSGIAAINMDDYLALANNDVKEITIEEYDGKITQRKNITSDDFLLVGRDTLYSKFGTVISAIKLLM